MKCPNCSRTIEVDSEFCVYCGSKVSQSSGYVKTVRIGRAADNDIVISDSRISGHHLKVRMDSANRIFVEDLNSTNGLYVNGERVRERQVSFSDRVSLGKDFNLDLRTVLGAGGGGGGSRGSGGGAPRPSSAEKQSVGGDLRSRERINIGRSNDNDIVISNIRVSRKHATLIRKDGYWLLEDLGSANGSYVNGRKISTCRVDDTDKITIGGVPLDIGKLFSAPKKDWSSDLLLQSEAITFQVGEKVIVDDITLCLKPGEFTGLIGPSGCGKTTLMLMLNGYLRPSKGQVYINELSLYDNPKAFQGQLGYVPQDDIIHRELTVTESLSYTSHLRLGNKISDSERDTQIKKIISDLNLGQASEVLIGSPEKKGISGGQRKRVNMAQELITEPLIYFLDEPTSGLDPRSDLEVMNLLKDMADRGHIVLLTTHKIDELNFSLFSHLIVMGPRGVLAYHGPASEACRYFGVKKPEDIFGVLEKRERAQLKQDYLKSSYCAEHQKGHFTGKSAPLNKAGKQSFDESFGQFLTLCKRNVQIKLRDTLNLSVLLLQAPIILAFILLVFDSYRLPHPIYFVLIVASIWLGFSNSAREIVSEQSIFKREEKAGLNQSAYLLSKITVLGALCFAQSILLALVNVVFKDFNMDYPALLFVLFITSFTATNMGLVLSSFVKTGESAMTIVPLMLIPQVVLGGMIVPYQFFSDLVKILAVPMISRWAFELLILIEDNPFIIGELGFDKDWLGMDIIIVLGMCILFIFTTKYLIKKRCQ